jgi:hypothetical protein
MVQAGKYVRPPGDMVKLLAFSSDLRTVTILEGYKKEGDLAINGVIQRGFDLSDADAMIHVDKNGKPTGIAYPVIYELASGVRLFKVGPPTLEKKNPEDNTRLERILRGLSTEVKMAVIKQPVKMEVDKVTLQLRADPRLHGKALDNALLKNALSLKSEIWQLVVCLLFGLIVGILVF